MDPPFKRPLLAKTATGIARTYECHPHSPWLWVRNKRVETIGPFTFRVIVYYSTRFSEPASDMQIDPLANPLEQPWEIEWDFVTTQEIIDRDIDGKPITNSSGESFNPPIMREWNDLLLRITRNEASFNPRIAASYKDAINLDWFWGFKPGTVRCVIYRAKVARHGALWYWRVNYAFQMREVGWTRKIRDEGYKALDSLDTTKGVVAIKDGDENIVSQPWPLDGHGFAFTQTEINAGMCYVLEFELYNKLPFSRLGM